MPYTCHVLISEFCTGDASRLPVHIHMRSPVPPAQIMAIIFQLRVQCLFSYFPIWSLEIVLAQPRTQGTHAFHRRRKRSLAPYRILSNRYTACKHTTFFDPSPLKVIAFPFVDGRVRNLYLCAAACRGHLSKRAPPYLASCTYLLYMPHSTKS